MFLKLILTLINIFNENPCLLCMYKNLEPGEMKNRLRGSKMIKLCDKAPESTIKETKTREVTLLQCIILSFWGGVCFRERLTPKRPNAGKKPSRLERERDYVFMYLFFIVYIV